MASPYLTEIRLNQPLKDDVKDVIRDVSNRFDVHGATRSRPVPHITLFGPYNTDQGYEARDRIRSVLSDYDIVPYRVKNFDHFGNHTIYVDVEPSPELQSLRRDIRDALIPISDNYPDHDTDQEYEFHITIAYKDISEKFDEIWEYVTSKYHFERKVYAIRVTALHNRNMMWEWDLPRGMALRSDEATTKRSWRKSEAALDRKLEDGTLNFAETKSNLSERFLSLLKEHWKIIL